MRRVWLLVLSWAVGLQWTDEDSGFIYDWSILERDQPWVVLSKLNDDYYTTVYSFAFGHDLKQSCSQCDLHTELQRLQSLKWTYSATCSNNASFSASASPPKSVFSTPTTLTPAFK